MSQQQQTTQNKPTGPKNVLRAIPENETFSPRLAAGEKDGMVTAKFAVRKARDDAQRYELNAVLDFSGCSTSELIELAARPVVIDVQRRWRELANSNMNEALDANKWRTVNVKRDIIDAARRQADPVAKAKRAIDKMSDAEKQALLAALQAS